MCNLGIRPSFDAGEVLLEVHLLGVERDLYGLDLRVRFVERLRGGWPLTMSRPQGAGAARHRACADILGAGCQSEVTDGAEGFQTAAPRRPMPGGVGRATPSCTLCRAGPFEALTVWWRPNDRPPRVRSTACPRPRDPAGRLARELLYQGERQQACCRPACTTSATELQATVQGVRPARRREVKAVTYAGLDVVEEALGRWTATITLDV